MYSMNIADRRLFAFKLPPLRADNGPAGGLPQALSGPHLGHGTRNDALMLIGVRFVVRRCFSAPQSRSASPLPPIRSCCSSTPPPPSPAPPRAAGRSIRSAVLRNRRFASSFDSLCGCDCSQGQGRRRRGRAAACRALLPNAALMARSTCRRQRRTDGC